MPKIVRKSVKKKRWRNMATKPPQVTPNDIGTRLDLIYAAVGKIKPRAMTKDNVQFKETTQPDGRKGFSMQVLPDSSPEDLFLMAMSAVHNISAFYAACKPYALRNGITAKQLNEVSDNCLSVKIIRDLDNKFKHPENPVNFSKLNPKLETVRAAVGLGAGSLFGVSSSGEKVIKNTSVVINAEIINEDTGKRVAFLADTLDKAVRAWEEFLAKHSIK
jgi:hypothetical protein